MTVRANGWWQKNAKMPQRPEDAKWHKVVCMPLPNKNLILKRKNIPEG